MEKISEIWRDYNSSATLLKKKLNRTSNLVGDYAEFLINKYIDGELLKASHASADIKSKEGKLYQVKSRKATKTTQLGIIRSWEFDFLAVVLFNENGNIFKALICPKEIAKNYAKENNHQNGWVISTTKDFINDSNQTDITRELKNINGEN